MMKKDAPKLAAFVRELRAAGIPVVNISGQLAVNTPPTVCGDDPLIGKLAAKHFAERRFANVAWFSSKWGRVHRLRFTGFAKAWETISPCADMPSRFVWSEHAPMNADTGWSEFSRWLGDCLGTASKPLGVFAYSDYDASRVIAICREHGLDVPGEVAVLGVDNNPIICENQVVPISSVNHNLERIGYAGAALLDRLMNGGTAPKKPVLVAPQGITLRRSTDTVAVNHPVLRSAMTFIKTHLSKPIGAPQVADGIGISRLQLDRLFAKELGLSVGREIARQRLVQAKLLLRNTDAPLSEIAKRTGFGNAAYLVTLFRNKTGVTPGVWRKRD
ncbi:MAG: substrate-binding domain-containing protein [Kiritimatiellae bacterium]|nr:substrate-binding domain-containing protein [Kiritimatiellia bacterium]